MIKAIIFDIGGVILDLKKILPPVVKLFQPKDNAAFWVELNTSTVPVFRGEMNLLDFWKSLAKKYNKTIPEQALKELWVKDFEKMVSINKEVEKIVFLLKEHYRLGIISNTIAEHHSKIMHYEVFRLFDTIILSHEVKMAKDGKDIFHLAAKKLNVLPEECVFIDDIPAFAENARSIGMTGIVFKNSTQLITELRKAGVNI